MANPKDYDPKNYVIEVHTTSRMWVVVEKLFVLGVFLAFAWEFVWDLCQPGGPARVGTWLRLASSIVLLAFVLDQFFNVFHRRQECAEVVAVRVAEDRAVVTDEKGQTTEFTWDTLQDVVVVARDKQTSAMVILCSRDQTAFIPEAVRDSDELAAEILRHTGFVPIPVPMRDPGYRRYGRGEAAAT